MKIKHIIIGSVVALFIVGVGFAVSLSQKVNAQAALEGTYQYVNLKAANASSSSVIRVRGGAGLLGKITVNRPASTTDVRIYDGWTATTTGNSTATSSGTLIGTLYATTTVGAYLPQTFEFDVAVNKGLVLDMPMGYGGDITISFK